MSVESFKKNLWESAILESFKGICVADAVTVAPSRVDGVKAIFNTVSLATGVQNYVGSVTYEGIDTVAKELVFDNKKYFASLSTFSEGSIALDFYDQTLVPEEEKEIYEASVKNETYFSLSISSYRHDRLFYQYSRLDGSLIVSQREGKFSYDKKVKINIPSYEGYENITEKLLKSYGIAV